MLHINLLIYMQHLIVVWHCDLYVVFFFKQTLVFVNISSGAVGLSCERGVKKSV